MRVKHIVMFLLLFITFFTVGMLEGRGILQTLGMTLLTSVSLTGYVLFVDIIYKDVK